MIGMISFLLLNSRIIIVSLVALFSLLAISFCTKKLESNRRTNIIHRWLNQIASDIKIYGFLEIFFLYVGFIYQNYYKANFNLGLLLAKINLIIFFFLITICWVEVGEQYIKGKIIHLNVSDIDKRNYRTLLPVAASILKLICYCLVFLTILSTLNVDITPILNIGGISLAALMYAGSETIKDFIATLKFFLSRKLYVGAYVKINNLRPGYVIRITIIDTWIETTLSNEEKIIQIISNGSIQIIVLLDPLEKT
jgi:small-conductance mechanosensitive channel